MCQSFKYKNIFNLGKKWTLSVRQLGENQHKFRKGNVNKM